MVTKTDGGRAFPWCGDLNECPTINLGMTLRDWFAGLAMQSYLQRPEADEQIMRDIAQASYASADAMLKARES